MLVYSGGEATGMQLNAARKKEEEDASIQMAPLIDCVFILLIFFLVTSMLQKPHKELHIDVPNAGAGEVAVEQPAPIIIVLSATNPDPLAPKNDERPKYEPYIILDDEPMTRDLLESRLRQVAKKTPGRHVRIDCDGHLAWRYVVPILDMCRFHGLVNVNVRTR